MSSYILAPKLSCPLPEYRINDGTDGNILGLLMGGNNAHIPAHDLQTYQIAGERSVLF